MKPKSLMFVQCIAKIEGIWGRKVMYMHTGSISGQRIVSRRRERLATGEQDPIELHEVLLWPMYVRT